MKIGICQIQQGYDFSKNINGGLTMIDEACAGGAELVVLPEMFFTPYEPAAIRKAVSFTQAAIDALAKKAAERGIYLVAGSVPFQEGERLFNRALVFDPSGRLVHTHDKIHLFDCTPPGGPKVKESETIAPGDRLGTFSTPWGEAAVIVCYDIRFTPLIQALVKKGIDLLFVPAAFSSTTGKAHWEMLIRLRAVEIQGFVVGVQPAANASLGYVPYGHSMIASPWGEKLFDAGEEQSVGVITLDMAEKERIRQTFPLRAHIRHDLYDTRWKGKS